MHQSLLTHLYAIYIFLAIMLVNIYSVYTQKNFIKLAKRLRFMTPLFHLSNAIIIYTGAIIAAYHHQFSFTIFLMIAASIFIMVLEIKRYKKQRVIKSDDPQRQEEFYVFAKKIYTIELAVLAVTYVVSKLF